MSRTAQAIEPQAASQAKTDHPYDLVARWVVRAAVFLLPIAFLPNVVEEFVLPKLLLVRLLLAAMAILLLVRWFMQGEVTWRRTPLDLPLLAFIGSAALSTIFAVNHNVAIFGTYGRWEGLLTIITYALVFWLAVQLLTGEADARGVAWSLLISGYLVGAVAILQSAFGLLGGGYFQQGTNIRADATLANPDFTGIFLAMLLPVAFAKVLSHRPAISRVIAANVLIVIAIGLLVTFTRAAWIGAVVGLIVVLALRRGRVHLRPILLSVTVIVIGFVVLAAFVASRPSTAQGSLGNALMARVVSIADLNSGTAWGKRLPVWRDTPALIANRPLLGYGPDTFGLVYPDFQSSNRSSTLFDKPHEDALGVAASQGILGLIAYVWILVAFVRAFWQGRYLRGAVALFAGWVAYEVSIQADFSWIPVSAPFWLFAAAAVVTWAPDVKPTRVAQFPRRIAIPALAGSSLFLLAMLIPAVIFPYLADARYYETQAAPNLQIARATIAQARQFAPYEAVYAIESGNYALNLDENGQPASNADWPAAREAYETAARLGSFSPEMFRELAIVDEHLGDHAAAVAAARRALELDRYDSASQKLLATLLSR